MISWSECCLSRNMRAVCTLAALLVSTAIAVQASPSRSPCSRIGNFSVLVREHALVGHVIHTSQVPSRTDCSFDCLSDQRCVSYNYEEGDKAVHQCELNSESEETKSSDLTSRAGFSYYDTGRNVPSGCESSPCINDGTCQDSCMKGSGYKCVCIEGRIGDKCQDWTVNAQNYIALFPNEKESDYLETEFQQALSELTVCMWIKTRKRSSSMAFLSLVTPGNETDFMFRCMDTKSCRLYIKGSSRQVEVFSFNNGLWHHLCWAWENVLGSWAVILDGSVMLSGKTWKTGLEIGPGKVTVGKIGSGINPEMLFVGEISSVNLWSAKLANSKIREMARSGSQELGNVTDWRMFRHGIKGDVEILSLQRLVSIAEENNYDLVFPSKSSNNYASYSSYTLPSLTRFTACLWMRTSYSGAHYFLSYSTSTYTNALVLGYDSPSARIAYSINQGNSIKFHSLSSAFLHDNGWHHLCESWKSSDGIWCVHINGDMSCHNGYKTGQTLEGGGKLFLGQEQDSYGGGFDSSQSFIGRLSRVNIWSHVFTREEIRKMSTGCGFVSGDVVAWQHFKSQISGDVQVETPSWCSVIGPTKQAKLDEYCRNHFSDRECSVGATMRAVFDRKHNQVGKQWRCYSNNSLTKDSIGYAYDTEKNLGCLFSRDSGLRELLLHGIKEDVEILSLQSPVSIVPDTEYVVEFPSRNVDNYIQPLTPIPSLQHFTVSFWINLEEFSGMAIFTHINSDATNAIKVYFGGSGALNLNIMSGNYKRYEVPFIIDGIWHHISVTWTNVEGTVQWFLDGALRKVESGYQTEITVPGGGTLQIGRNSNEYPFKGMLTRINIWSTVLEESVIEAMAKGPGAEIGDVVSWIDLRTSLITGEVTVHQRADLQPLAEENNFDLLFASKSSNNYASYSSYALPSLTKFTVCLWMRTSYSGVHYFLSYSTSTYSDALALGYDASEAEIDFNINGNNWKYHALSSAFLHDNGWHHLCVSWRSSDGNLCIYVNRKMSCQNDYVTGQTLEGNGKLFLGQEQDSYGGGFDSSQAFIGRLSRVNIWSRVLSENTITKMSTGCGFFSGDVVAWQHFKSQISGDVQVETPSWCSVIGPTKQAKLDEYCRNHFYGGACSEGTTTRAVFDKKQNQVGKQWRCYYDNVLTKDSTGYAFDTVKNVGCLHSQDSQLRNLLLE